MSGKIDWIKSIKQWFNPKVGSYKWFKSASTQEIKDYREELWKELMDPNEDTALRIRIRDHIFPYIDKILYDRDD